MTVLGGSGKLPVFIKPMDLGSSLFNENRKINRFPGFANDGDFIVLTGIGGGADYYNAAGVQQWTKSKADFGSSGGSDYFLDGWLNDDGSLLYMLYSRATSPRTYALSTINASGTIALIGANQIDADFSTLRYSSGLGYNLNCHDTSGSNLELWTFQNEYITINKSNGNLSNRTAIFNHGSTENWGNTVAYKTVSTNLYVGAKGFGSTYQGEGPTTQWLDVANAEGQHAYIPFSGLGSTLASSYELPKLWRGKIVFGVPNYSNNGHQGGSRFFERDVFDAAILKGAKIYGLA
jgi:hypothetical protein